MSAIRVGIQLAGLRLPLRQALETAARLKAEVIEIDARNEIRPVDVAGTALRQLGTKSAMKLAFDLGANVVVNSAGHIDTTADSPSREILRGVLSDLGKYSHHVGAMLALETGAESLSLLGELIDSLPQAGVGVTLNPGNLIVNGFGLEDLPAVAKHVMLVHAKDGLPDRARGRGTQVPLGRGLAEFPQIIACLAEHSYRGCYIVERDMASDPVAEFAASMNFLRSL
ncbi:MAG: TIM barrel protein [Planctomycetota bacterium]|nr:TIM barrel protein [Planctomycetota bacterium]